MDGSGIRFLQLHQGMVATHLVRIYFIFQSRLTPDTEGRKNIKVE